MFFLVLAVLVTVGALVCLSVGSVTVNDSTYRLRWAAPLLMLVAGLFVFFASMYRLDAGEAAVLRSVTHHVIGHQYSENGGTHFKAPWVSVEKFDVRNQQINFLPGKDADDIPISASTSDNASASIDVTLTYNQDPEKVEDIYKTYKSEANMRTQLIRVARSVLQEAPTHYATLELRPKRASLQSDYLKALSARLNSFGITVTSVDVRGISFPKDVQNSLDAVQARNADVEKARAGLEQARIDAEKVKVDAKAQSDADQIARCGATITQETQVINGKETQVSVVTPVPSDQCQSRLNEQVLTSKYIDMLRERTGDTFYVLPKDVASLLNLAPAPK